MDVTERRLTPAALRGLRLTKQQLLNEKSAKDGLSPILAAATNSHVDVVRCLAKNNANINDTNPEGQTSLILAAKNGCHSILRLMVHYSANLDIQDNRGRTALMHALAEGYLDLARTLIDAGASQKLTDRDGRTALFVAAECGHLEIVEHLLTESSSELNVCDRHGRSVLMMLARAGKAWSAYKYINQSQLAAIINSCDAVGWTPLLHAVGAGQFAMASQLIAWGADSIAVTAEGQTVVMLACQKPQPISDANFANTPHGSEVWNQTSFISAMLKRGVSLSAADKNGRTALFYAVESSQLETLRHLLSLNVGQLQLDARDVKGWTVLHAAARSGCESVVRYLLTIAEVSNLVNVPNSAGDVPLRLAIIAKSLGTVNALLESGASLELAEKTCHPLLCLTAEFGAVDIVDFLLKKGFNVDVCDTDDVSALMTATRYDNLDVVERLLKASAKVNLYNSKGSTALVFAVQTSNIAMCKSLLSCGANPNLLPEGKTECKTAISIAATLGNCAMIELLLSYDADPFLRDPQDRNSLYYCVLMGRAAPLKHVIKWAGPIELDEFYPHEGQKYTLLAIATERGFIEVATLLLLGQASIEVKTSLGESSMHIACRRQNLRFVHDFLTFTFVVNSPRDSDQFTPLMIACQFGNIEMANYLCQWKADPNVRTPDGYTALILAAASGSAKAVDRVPLVSYLLANGARFDIDADKKLLGVEGLNLVTALSKSSHVGKSPRIEGASTEVQTANSKIGLSGEMTIEMRLKMKLKNKQLQSQANKEQQASTKSVKKEAAQSDKIHKIINSSAEATEVSLRNLNTNAKISPLVEKIESQEEPVFTLPLKHVDENKLAGEFSSKIACKSGGQKKTDEVQVGEEKIDSIATLVPRKNSSDVNARAGSVDKLAAKQAKPRTNRPLVQLLVLYRLKCKTKSAKPSNGMRKVLIRRLNVLKARAVTISRVRNKWRLPVFWEHARLRTLLKRRFAPRVKWLDEAAKLTESQLLEKFIVLNLSKLSAAVEESKIWWAPLPEMSATSECQAPKRRPQRTRISRLLKQLGSEGNQCSLFLRCGHRSTDVKLAIEREDRERQIDLCFAIQPVRFESPQYRLLMSKGSGLPDGVFKLAVDTSSCLWDPCDLLALCDTLEMEKQNSSDTAKHRRSLDTLIGRQTYHLFSLTGPARPQELPVDTGMTDRVALHSALSAKLVSMLLHAELSSISDLPYTFHGDDVLCCQQLPKVPSIQKKLTDILGPDRIKLVDVLEFS